ncbi:MAG: DNA gyrase subunit A [Marivibrio sp.]|uniref:DNA gyrase subunit A n=1 Tax=Marivibrio sp. TaxID=2039719 RepID=UPI0032F00416
MGGGPGGPGDVSSVLIEDEMRSSYLDYAMSVIVSRALPDVRDGLKPVHRRILYAMKEGGYDSTKPYRKSARIVGDVMGKYHPHGDSAIYDAMVRMAQDFSLRLPLIDGQGNFGSMDGDAAAAMRYTEARLAKAAETLLDDIDKDTVDFQPNYDESEREPSVLPARFPNLLVNGGGGIAVGMATNIPPHNLGEVVDACIAWIDDPDISDEALMELVPGPDFPTGATILGRSGIRAAYTTGRGSVVMRAKIDVEERGQDRLQLVVTEIPYQVNKARMIERIAEVVRDKTIEGIGDLRDESDRDGVRVVIELKRGVEPEVVKAQLFRFTPLQTSFGVNMLALNGGKPEMMRLRDVLEAFTDFREEVIKRRTAFELAKARDRAHILTGLMVAITNLDPVIELIRAAPDPATARASLMGRSWPAAEILPYLELIDDPEARIEGEEAWLSERQARAILELRLQRLTGMEREKLEQETKEIAERIKEYLEILASRARRYEVMKEELLDIKQRFDTPRRTVIEENEFEHDIEDLIQREEMVVTVTHGGYIKRVPLSTYRAQRRGGKGRTGMAMKDEDFVGRVFVASTHTPVLFFSSRGMVYQMKVYKLPLGSPQARGKALVNLLPMQEGEFVTTIMPLPEDEESWDALNVMFATASGAVRRNALSDFTNIKANGKIAMKLEEGDRLVDVKPCQPGEDVLLATAGAMSIRFPVEDVRLFAGRNSVGVRGVRLAEGDEVISMAILRHSDASPDDRNAYLQAASAARRLANPEYGGDGEDRARDEERAAQLEAPEFRAMRENEEFILTISDRGMGQLASAYDYRVTGRGGKGINNMKTRGAKVAASFWVDTNTDELMLVTDGGQIIRCRLDELTPKSRNTQGVRLFDIGEGQRVVSVARLTDEGDDGEMPPASEAEDAEGPVDAPDAPSDAAPDASSRSETDE